MRLLALFAVGLSLSACGTEHSSEDGEVTADGLVAAPAEETPPPPASSVSNENFARLIAATGLPQRCISLGSWAGERTSRDRAQTGLLDFNAFHYNNPAPAWIAELVNAGVLRSEGQIGEERTAMNVYRATPGNEEMFRWVDDDGARGGSYHFCPGKLDVTVVSYDEPAEERGFTRARYTYRVSDIPPAIQAMMDSGQIATGTNRNAAMRATVSLEGEGEMTLRRTSNGWEARPSRY